MFSHMKIPWKHILRLRHTKLEESSACLLETVGGSIWPQNPLSLAVVRPVQRVHVVTPVLPQVEPQRVCLLTKPANTNNTT